MTDSPAPRHWHTHDFGAGRVHVHDHPDADDGHVHPPCKVVVDEKGQRMYLPSGDRWPGEVTPKEHLAAAEAALVAAQAGDKLEAAAGIQAPAPPGRGPLTAPETRAELRTWRAEYDRSAVTALLRQVLAGEFTVEEAADRLYAMGVTHLGILSAVVEMPEGQGSELMADEQIAAVVPPLSDSDLLDQPVRTVRQSRWPRVIHRLFEIRPAGVYPYLFHCGFATGAIEAFVGERDGSEPECRGCWGRR